MSSCRKKLYSSVGMKAFYWCDTHEKPWAECRLAEGEASFREQHQRAGEAENRAKRYVGEIIELRARAELAEAEIKSFRAVLAKKDEFMRFTVAEIANDMTRLWKIEDEAFKALSLTESDGQRILDEARAGGMREALGPVTYIPILEEALAIQFPGDE